MFKPTTLSQKLYRSADYVLFITLKNPITLAVINLTGYSFTAAYAGVGNIGKIDCTVANSRVVIDAVAGTVRVKILKADVDLAVWTKGTWHMLIVEPSGETSRLFEGEANILKALVT